MIVHILKDGTRLTDISGHVVKLKDAKAVYDLMDKINGTSKRKGGK